MRRRRLALRQVAESTQHVSDIDDDDSDNDNGKGGRRASQSDKPPTFSLLTVTTVPGAPPPLTTEVVIELTDSDDNGEASKPGKKAQHQTSDTARTSPHVPTSSDDKQTHDSAAYSIFHLYQEGLTSDQVLQLAFTRRRAPRPVRSSLRDAFVLPLPTLRVQDVLALSQHTDLRGLFVDSNNDAAAAAEPPEPPVAAHCDTVAAARASAEQYFQRPETAPVYVRHSWRILSELDWRDVYNTLVRRDRNDTDATTSQSVVVSAAAACVLLRDCGSDALVQFVWSTLLVAACRCVESNADANAVAAADAAKHELLALLVAHRWFRAMAPTEFRATVRAAQLRQRLGDAARGAQIELQLLALYHRNRERL